MKKRRRILFVTLFFLVGCVTAQEHSSQPTIPIPLDPVFWTFNEDLGGDAVLGKVISPARNFGNKKTQFVTNALLLYDPDAEASVQVRLWPVGNEMGFTFKPIPRPSNIKWGSMFIEGHVIPPEFAPLYNQLGGERVVGKPLTELIYSPTYRRFEQYFENLGFYRPENAPVGDVRLLAYGSWGCKPRCQEWTDKKSIVDVQVPIQGKFLEKVDECGIEFSGYLLEDFSFETEEGLYQEAIFKNLVLRTNIIDLTQVEILPLPELVGIRASELTTPTEDPEMVFIPVSGEMQGINVKKEIFDYVQNHGGTSIAGLPFTEFKEYGRIYRQCFTNICLLYDPGAEPWLKIYPEPLGYTYLKLFHHEFFELITSNEDSPQPVVVSNVENNYIINTWEGHPSISVDDSQTIYAAIYDLLNQPISGLKTTLTVTIPGTGDTFYPLPLTDSNGITNVKLPAIIAPKGTLIPYSICIEGETQRFCKADSYVIWSDP